MKLDNQVWNLFTDPDVLQAGQKEQLGVKVLAEDPGQYLEEQYPTALISPPQRVMTTCSETPDSQANPRQIRPFVYWVPTPCKCILNHWLEHPHGG